MDVSATTDAKYLEVGISSKSDNADILYGFLQREYGITDAECSFWGDEYAGDGSARGGRLEFDT